MTDNRKTSKVLIIVMSSIAFMLAAGMIGCNIVRLYGLQSSLLDVYFLEYVNGTTIYKYDVNKRKTVVEAVLEGGRYSDCKINRTENYIVGEFWRFGEKTGVLLRYNLADGTTEEITGKEAEIMEERIKEAEDRLPKRDSLPEGVKKTVWNYPISWSVDGNTAAFSDTNQKNIYLYHADVRIWECVLTAGWNRTFGGDVGLDASGRYIFYEDNFNYFFDTADVRIVVYDTKTKMRTKIYSRRYTQISYKFVQDLDFE